MLTPEQRIEAYYYAMLMIFADKREKAGVCVLLDNYAIKIGEKNSWQRREKLFPEFNKHKPNREIEGWETWWPFDEQGNATRLSVLSACIEEVEKGMKENKSS